MDALYECIKKGTAPVRVVDYAKEYLKAEGYEELYYNRVFFPKAEGRYFMAPYPDVLFAFTMGTRRACIQNLRMAFAHVDQPCFRIKGQPAFSGMGCSQINVSVYGGIMDHTWFDRPLGMAGTIALKGEDIFHPELISYDSKAPIAIIPGLAIHMNRGVNEGWKIDRQKELMPVTGLAGASFTNESFLRFLGKELNVDESEILRWDLYLYNYDSPMRVGFAGELISAPRIDNLASVSAMLTALVEGEREDGINFIGLYNHEEVGSMTRSGAHSGLTGNILKEIFEALGATSEMYRVSMAESIYLSLDGAHAAHPNYPEKCDTTTRALMGRGPAIKESDSGRYATDCRVSAILHGLADKYEVPLQIIADRSSIRGGSTLGPMIGSHLSMSGCDIGIPMWSMHSARETMSVSDYQSLCQLLTAFFME